jgi:hypothetical protein
VIILKKPKSPCLNCADRSIGCHSKCEIYKTWKSQHKSKQKIIRQAKQEITGHYYFSEGDAN